MIDVFISHVEEDTDLALETARGLEAAGYETWCYERDGYPGPDYLDQVDRAIRESQAVLVVISPDSLGSQQVEDEVKWAREQQKHFVPVLKGISWTEFQSRRPRWRMALGIAAAVRVPTEGVGAILPRVVRGLQELGVKPGGTQRPIIQKQSETSAAVPEAPAAQGGRRLWKIAVPVLLVALLVAGGLYYRSHQQGNRLTDKDTIVLSDFDNKTGDPVFDGTLKTALNVSLRQSPFLSVLSDQQVAETLKLMTRPADTKLTPAVTRELCQRAGSKAYIAGSIASLGSQFVLGLKAGKAGYHRRLLSWCNRGTG